MSVVENIQNVRAKIAAAAEKSGRTAEDVLLLAVSKTKPVELIGEAVQAGCLSLGENKVQEIMEKYEPMMEYAPEGERIHWHLIGHLQTNKVKYIIDKVSMIHSVDSVRLAETIEKEAAKKDMESMLDYIDKLNELDTSNVEPMSHVFPVQNVFREDVVENGDGGEDTLANAPERRDRAFVVPKTVE